MSGWFLGRPRSTATALAVLAVASTVCAATALAALVSLDGRVDNDPAAGISPAKPAGELDAVGGAVTAGAAAVPWTVFEKQTSGKKQIFSRAFANGA